MRVEAVFRGSWEHHNVRSAQSPWLVLALSVECHPGLSGALALAGELEGRSELTIQGSLAIDVTR